MKKIAVICLLLVSLRARGDLVVVEETVAFREAPSTMTIKIKGDKCREDFSDRTSIIYDLSTGDSIRIAHATMSYKRISAKQEETIINALKQEGASMPEKPPKIVDTGKTEKVNGHDAEIYTAHTPAATFTYWVTKDYPDYAALRDEMKKFQSRSDAMNKTGYLLPDPTQLDGLVVKSTRLSSAGSATIVTLVSAKIQALDDVEFKPPAGYKEIE
jgi:hypothetical protein